IDGVVYSIIINDNFIDYPMFVYMVNHMGSKCLRFRVRTECKEWSTWCCITSYGWAEGGYKPNDPDDQYFNTCLDEIDFDKLDPNAGNLTAYPNPTTGFVSVTNSNATVFEFYDLNQKVVKTVRLAKTK